MIVNAQKIMDELCRVNYNLIENYLKNKADHRVNTMCLLGNTEIDSIPIGKTGDYSALSEETRADIEDIEHPKVYIASGASNSAFSVKVLVVAYDHEEDILTFLGFDEERDSLVWYSPFECVAYSECAIYNAVDTLIR